MRFGPGCAGASWARSSLYRIAGGEAGHAPLHGPVRPCAEVAVDQADGRPRADRRAARPLCRAVRRPGRPQAPGMSLRELEALRDDCLVAVLQGLRNRSASAQAGRSTASSAPLRPRHPPGRRRRHQPCRSGLRTDRAQRVGRLQRPHQRQPLPAAQQRGRRSLHAPHRRRRGLPATGRLLLHGREPPQLRAAEHGRRPAVRRRCSCWPTTTSGSTSSPRCTGRTTTAVVGTAEHMLLHVDTASAGRSPPSAAVRAKLAGWLHTTTRCPARRRYRQVCRPAAPGPAASGPRDPTSSPSRRGPEALPSRPSRSACAAARRRRRCSGAPCGGPCARAERDQVRRVERRRRGGARRRPSRRPRVSSLGTAVGGRVEDRGCSFTTSSTSKAEMFSPRRRMQSVLPADEVEVAVGVAPHEVAGVEPRGRDASRSRCLRHAVVAVGDQRRLVGRGRRSRRPRRRAPRCIVVVEQAHVVLRDGPAARPGRRGSSSGW